MQVIEELPVASQLGAHDVAHAHISKYFKEFHLAFLKLRLIVLHHQVTDRHREEILRVTLLFHVNDTDYYWPPPSMPNRFNGLNC